MTLARRLTTGCLLVFVAALAAQQDSFVVGHGLMSTMAPMKAGPGAAAASASNQAAAPFTTAHPHKPPPPPPTPTTHHHPAPHPPPPPPPPPPAHPQAHPTRPAQPAQPAHPTHPTHPAHPTPAAAKSTTMKPADKAAVAASVAVAAAHNGPMPGQKLASYFEPICEHQDKLNPEHMFKVQSQMKQFIEKTAGKMSVCFMQVYMIDPNLSPVNKAQLSTICSSIRLPGDNKGSFKNFQACSEHNWDKNLDQELDHIIKKRLNCFFNHAHSKNDSTISLIHESDDIKLIGEVVGKVLNDNKNVPFAKSNIKMFEVNAPAPVGSAKPNAPLGSLDQSAKKILNDPNTLLVLVDDSKATTKTPVHHQIAVIKTHTPAAHTPAPHHATAAPVIISAGTTIKPQPTAITVAPHPTKSQHIVTVLGDKILKAVTTHPPASHAAASAAAAAAAAGHSPTVAPAKPTSSPIVVTHAPAKEVVVVVPSTSKPTSLAKVATLHPTVKMVANEAHGKPHAKETIVVKEHAAHSTTAKPVPSTAKPLSTASPTPVQLVKHVTSSTGKPTPAPPAKQEKEKETAKKEEDAKDAKNAIKALQAQRQHHAHDARLHQIEHERQMTIDPIGHTLKHQRYEQMKHMRTSTKSPSAASSSAPDKKS